MRNYICYHLPVQRFSMQPRIELVGNMQNDIMYCFVNVFEQFSKITLYVNNKSTNNG